MHVWQGSQRPGKSWKTWKMKKASFRPGKVTEFKKKAKIMEFQNTSKTLFSEMTYYFSVIF